MAIFMAKAGGDAPVMDALTAVLRSSFNVTNSRHAAERMQVPSADRIG